MANVQWLSALAPSNSCEYMYVTCMYQTKSQTVKQPLCLWSCQNAVPKTAQLHFHIGFMGSAATCCNYIFKLPPLASQGWAESIQLIQLSKWVLFQTTEVQPWWFWPPSFPRCNWDAHPSTVCFDVIAKLQGFIEVKNDQIHRLVRTSTGMGYKAECLWL